MWNMMNAVRHRVMPRRRNGMGTMTALLVGASVGIAAWEAVRKTQWGSMGSNMAKPSQNNAADIAQEVMQEIES